MLGELPSDAWSDSKVHFVFLIVAAQYKVDTHYHPRGPRDITAQYKVE